MNNPMILVGLKTGKINVGISRMPNLELMNGLNYELLFFESLKPVVHFSHPLPQGNATLSRALK